MRDVVYRFGKDPNLVNFACPVSLIVDHSPSVDFAERYVMYEENYVDVNWTSIKLLSRLLTL